MAGYSWYDYDPGQSGGHWEEEPIDPSVSINHIWAVFNETNGNLIQVDIYNFLIQTCLIEDEEVESTILERIKNYEPNLD